MDHHRQFKTLLTSFWPMAFYEAMAIPYILHDKLQCRPVDTGLVISWAREDSLSYLSLELTILFKELTTPNVENVTRTTCQLDENSKKWEEKKRCFYTLDRIPGYCTEMISKTGYTNLRIKMLNEYFSKFEKVLK